jgi:hypothetical protein
MIKIDKYFLIFVSVILCFFGNTQTFTMTSGGNASSCSGTVYDPGGTGNYASNANVTYTICPSTPGSFVTLTFTSFNLESNFDYLKIYAGSGTGGALLGNYTGSTIPASITSSATNGCLTLVFTSDGSVVYTGFAATISCTTSGGGGGGGSTGCTNTSSFGTATAPTSNTTTTISSCTYQTEYNTITNIVAGKTYTLNSSCGGFVTIHSGTFNGPVVASGNAPLTWTAATSGTFYVSWNTNSSCGTATNCCTTTIACTNCSSGSGTGGCVSLSGNSSCATADPFCSNSGLTFCNTTNVASLGSGGAYGCLFSTPNPSFFYLNIGSSGSITMTISQTTTTGAGIDVDYVLWGPFSSQNAMCSGYSASNIVACSYSAAAIETATICAIASAFDW